MTIPQIAPPLTPLQTAAGTFVETDSRSPGNVMVNLSQVLYIEPGDADLAVCVFQGGFSLLLNVTYEQVRTGIQTGTPAP